jgi:serine protease Do
MPKFKVFLWFRSPFVFSLVLVLVMFAGCNSSYRSQQAPYIPEAKPPSCDAIKDGKWFYDRDVEQCEQLALSGDLSAMLRLAQLYEGRVHLHSGSKDAKQALKWLNKAHELGSSEAVERLYHIYGVGDLVSRNTRISDSFLNEGVEKGYAWALNADIGRKVRVGDESAIDSLIKQAILGNCRAQSSLAFFYVWGSISPGDKIEYKVGKNLTKAYFWSLVAKAADSKGEHYNIYGYNSPFPKFDLYSLGWEKRKQIPEDLIAKAEDAATLWTPGMPEPELPALKKKSVPKVRKKITKSPINKKNQEKKQAPDKIIFPNIGELELIVDKSNNHSNWKWLPVSLPNKKNTGNDPHNSEELFRITNKYVWKVFAARSIGHLRRGADILQGSAVAISRNQLLTNCHVVKEHPIIFIKHEDKFAVAKVISGNIEKDQCVLKVSGQVLVPVKGIRSYSSLNIGESVFTVGSPSGLENTLGKGIISGLRNRKDQRLVQTTAQISPGSSGGGLFDDHGNLIGITTFMLENTQSLNFAVAVEEYGE